MSEGLNTLASSVAKLVDKLDAGFERSNELILLRVEHNTVAGNVAQHHDDINRLKGMRTHLMGQDGQPGRIAGMEGDVSKNTASIETNQKAIQQLLEKHNGIALKVGMIIGGVSSVSLLLAQWLLGKF